jgi:serine/threonine protein kinase
LSLHCEVLGQHGFGTRYSSTDLLRYGVCANELDGHSQGRKRGQTSALKFQSQSIPFISFPLLLGFSFFSFWRRLISSLSFLKILWDIARGMYFMHSNKYVHRDLKTDNVLVRLQFRFLLLFPSFLGGNSQIDFSVFDFVFLE